MLNLYCKTIRVVLIRTHISLLAEEQGKLLRAREIELAEELEAKETQVTDLESDLEAVRMTAAETQVELERLNRRAQEAEATAAAAAKEEAASSSQMEERARKYPELKAVAFDLKARLVKRAE